MWQSLRKVYLESRKPEDSVFNNWVARPLATPLVIFFEKLRVRPNLVTLLGLWFMLLAGGCWIAVVWREPDPLSAQVHLWVGLGLAELAYLFDCADGQLARRMGCSSRLGGELDFLVDELKAYILVVSLSIFWWATEGVGVAPLIWGAGGVAAVASALAMTRFIRSDVVQDDGVMGSHSHGESATGRQRRGPLWWLLVPARLITQYPQSLPIFFFLDAVGLFVMLYVSLHSVYAGGRLCQISLRLSRR